MTWIDVLKSKLSVEFDPLAASSSVPPKPSGQNTHSTKGVYASKGMPTVQTRLAAKLNLLTQGASN